MQPLAQELIKGRECKHVVYCPSNDPQDPHTDVLFVKEVIHATDGRLIPNTYLLKDFKRDFYITKPGFQNHTDKKEWEDIDKLRKYTTTQAKLTQDIARALGMAPKKQQLKILARSPFLYGCDITTPTIVKKHYQDKNPNIISDNTVAVLDIETDVVKGHEEPILVGITFKDKAFLAATQEFIGTVPNPIEKLHKKFNELLNEYVEKRNLKLEVVITRDAGEACAQAIAKAHQWQPDFVTLWNMNFDIPRIKKCLERYQYDLAEVFSDPKVPKQFKYFKYTEGPSKKVTVEGKITPIHPADRWHTAECPASFQFIDSMCLYKRIRLAAQNEASYSLDFQLNQHLGIRKLKFEQANHLSGLDWHQFMQTHHKIEYGIYNLFDCIGVELFDEKVKDLSKTISVLSGYSEYKIFNSQPKRLVDQYHYFCLEKGKVIASWSDQMEDDLDRFTYDKRGWIITLPSHLTLDNGVKVVKGYGDLRSMIRTHVADLDIVGSYPHGQVILNLSKETTYRELCKIRGMSEHDQRFAGVNLTASHVNAVEFCQAVFKLPKLDTLLESFKKDLN